jgi:NADP-dependent 3-hydroxy acid dehydrogenase YdfG
MTEADTTGQTPNALEGKTTALVTGCAAPLGATIAEYLHDEGWQVYATARDQADISGLAETGCETVTLDVTDPEESHRVVDHVIDEAGSIDSLINSPTMAALGPVEDIPPRRVRRQFDSTVFGFHRLVRATLPHMRESGGGTILTVTGIVGRMSAPGAGIYASSEFAVEGLCDALRAEVSSHDIDIVLVEPGHVTGRFSSSMPEAAERSAAYDDIYGFYDDASVLEDLATSSPTDVAATVHQAVTCANPAPRYPVGRLAALLLWARYLPDSIRDGLFQVLRRLP